MRTKSITNGLVLAAIFVTSCVSATNALTNRLEPANTLPARERAKSIYLKYIARSLSVDDPGAIDAFPDAPVEIAQSLKLLASSRNLEEKDQALCELSGKLDDSGLYSRVEFKSRPRRAVVRYKRLGRDKVHTARNKHVILAIGSYYVWIEIEGKAITPRGTQYDVIREKEVIELRGDAHGQRQKK